MSITQLKVASAGLFFLFIFLSGFWLSNSGRPINVIILTIHKLIALAALVFLTITIYQVNQVTRLSNLELIASIATGLFFIGTIITGGLLSLARPMPGFVLRLHQITPVLIVLSAGVTLYLLLFVRGELPTT
jgi:hypothetical protein